METFENANTCSFSEENIKYWSGCLPKRLDLQICDNMELNNLCSSELMNQFEVLFVYGKPSMTMLNSICVTAVST